MRPSFAGRASDGLRDRSWRPRVASSIPEHGQAFRQDARLSGVFRLNACGSDRNVQKGRPEDENGNGSSPSQSENGQYGPALNGRDWHGLLDFCAVVGCLVGDRDRLYDPGSMEDRMYLGMRGAFSEFELSVFRKRSLESRMAKAARGELFLHLPAGYDKVGRDAIEMSPDQRVRNAIRLVFATFDELGSVRQTWLWFRNEQVEIPVRTPARGLGWRVPTEDQPSFDPAQSDLRRGLCLWPQPDTRR